MLSHEDILTLQAKGITNEQLENQLRRFATGFPYLRLDHAATPGNGITCLDKLEEAEAETRWSEFLVEGGEVVKMVPASGAASRMFKSLFSFVDGDIDVPAQGSDVAEVIAGIEKFAFRDDLEAALKKNYGLGIEQMKQAGRYKEIISAIINHEGLDYGNLPKGLLKFHGYEGSERRTPLEEQLAEGAATVADRDGNVRVHFTVSTDHRKKFEEKLAEVIPAMEKKLNKKFHVSLSEQKPSTDTVAANEDNTPFRDNGKLVFRPGGHGALIQNLNDLHASIVFIKNIDNVVPDSHREPTLHYKRVIGGYLLMLHDEVTDRLLALDDADRQALESTAQFLQSKFSVMAPAGLSDEALREFLRKKLNRPMRVCGMVKNEGEPGGGPFVVKEDDGSTSLQILESTQIDMTDPASRDMLAGATHFNPVDLVCYVNDINGNHFNLPDFVDEATGFISSKSLHGRALKALELPGLWNGAMSDWLTAFVEVPIATFNPVKTVNDLLRPAHQQ